MSYDNVNQQRSLRPCTHCTGLSLIPIENTDLAPIAVDI